MKVGKFELTAAYEINPDQSKTALPFTTMDEAMAVLEAEPKQPRSYKRRMLAKLASKFGVINAYAYYFRDDPPAYWVLGGDNIEMEDLGGNFKQAVRALEKAQNMHGQKIQLHEYFPAPR